MRACSSVGVVFVCAGLAFSAVAPAVAQDEFVEMVVNLLGDDDGDIRAVALEQVRTDVPGEEATRRFAEGLVDLPPRAQVGLLGALTDRGDGAAAPAVRDILGESGDLSVRVAALKAIGVLGGPQDVALLLDRASSGAQQQQDAARRGLVTLPGEESTAEIVTELKQRPSAQRITLLEALTARRARSTAKAILKAAVDEDPAVRAAAMKALGELAGPEHVAGMVPGVLKAERGRERDAAEKAIMFVCQRAGDQAKPLLAAMESLPQSEQTLLLPGLGRVGGPDALAVVERAIQSPESDVHTAGIRAICNWPRASIAPRLIELAGSEKDPGISRMAVRALIRVAPLPDERSDSLRLQLLQTAYELCQNDADRMSVLERAKAVRSIETLRFVAPFMDQPEFAEQACLTVVELAHHSQLRAANEEEFHLALDRVIATSGDAVVIDRAQRYKKGQTWVRPKSS